MPRVNWLQYQNKPALFTDTIFSNGFGVSCQYFKNNLVKSTIDLVHGLRTPNEGINQRYLKNWADVAEKICSRHT